MLSSFRSERFRYDPPLHDLDPDDWSEEIRFGSGRPRKWPVRYRGRKRARGFTPTGWARPWLQPGERIPVVPFRSHLDLDGRCRTLGGEPLGVESEAQGLERGGPLERELFLVRQDVEVKVTWTGPATVLDFQRETLSFSAPTAFNFVNAVYVMMDPTDHRIPWYVGQSKGNLNRYLSERLSEVRRLGATRCLSSCRLCVYAARVEVPRGPQQRDGSRPDLIRWGTKEGTLPLVEAVVTRLFGATAGNGDAILRGNVGNERQPHALASREGKSVTIRFNQVPAAFYWRFFNTPRATLEHDGRRNFTFKLSPVVGERGSHPVPRSQDRSARRSFMQTYRAQAFEVAPFPFP